MNNFKFSPLHRFLHWSIALAIILILITVFLRLGWMNKNVMADVIFKHLQEKQINISKEETLSIAKEIRGNMFNWHVYIGYLLMGLYIIRILYLLIKGPMFENPLSKNSTNKKKLQSIIYIIFYIGLGITLITGVFIENGHKEYKKSVESIHQLSLYFMLGFLILHLAGIFLAEKTSEKGIVSAMINGGNKDKNSSNSFNKAE